jgi:hypothetical protein
MNSKLPMHGELFFATGVCYALLGTAASIEAVASLRRIYRVVGWQGSSVFYDSILRWKLGFLVSVAVYGAIYAFVLIRNIGMGEACPTGDPKWRRWTFRMRFSLLLTIAQGCALLGFACAIRLWEDVLCDFLPDVQKAQRRRIIAVSVAASLIPLVISGAIINEGEDGCQVTDALTARQMHPSSSSLWWTVSGLINHVGNLALGLLFLSFARRVQKLTLTAYPRATDQLVLKQKVRKLIATMCVFTLCFVGQIGFGITSLFLNESLDRKMFALSCGCGNLTSAPPEDMPKDSPATNAGELEGRIPLPWFVVFECLLLIIPLSVLLYLLSKMHDKIIVHNWQAAKSANLSYRDFGDSLSTPTLHLHMLTSMDNSNMLSNSMPTAYRELEVRPRGISVEEANKRFELAKEQLGDFESSYEAPRASSVTAALGAGGGGGA